MKVTLACLTFGALFLGSPFNLSERVLPGQSRVASPRSLAAEQAPRKESAAPIVVRDDRLELSLFVSDPQIVTPIGIAVDGANRVYVLESHTHSPPSGYAGPGSDRIKVFTDADADGKPEQERIFAGGFDDGMNIAFSPEGELYVVTSRAVWRLHDRDRDGVSEGRTAVLRMTRPERVYDHAALLGLAFSADGWLYVSRGNTGGAAWRMDGADGASLSGYGDGGNIMRCRTDGSDLQEVATGFWNPFDVKFDTQGRLLAADNDPDSRGPNRLVHVVEGGDYGYRSLYGGSGTHPYLAWNGDLPGTLPYAVALGEAPAGMFVAAAGSLPADYRNDLLVSVWEERRIVRVRLEPRDSSVQGTAVELVRGGDGFRPVAFAADRAGTIYITDWTVREYPNHGKGRIWRLRSKPGVPVTAPRAADAPPDPDPAGDDRKRLRDAPFDRLRAALRSGDPFVRGAAVTALTRSAVRADVIQAVEDPDPAVRLGALLALMQARHENGEAVASRLFADPDLAVRKMAFIWAGRAGMTALQPAMHRAMTTGPPDPELFEIYLETVRQLSPAFIDAYRSQAAHYAKDLPRPLPPQFVEAFVSDTANPGALRAVALTHLEGTETTAALLVRLTAAGSPPAVRMEALRSLASLNAPMAARTLVAIARDPLNPVELRAESLVALGSLTFDASDDALALLRDRDKTIRIEAARYLRSRTLDPPALARVGLAFERLGRQSPERAQLARLLGVGRPATPSTAGSWEAALDRAGDPASGRRVFFSAVGTCSACHAVERRGGDLGPDLTHAGRSKTRAQLLDAILRPSAEVSPEYQGWFIRTADGAIHTGRQIDVADRKTAELYVASRGFVTFRNVEEYGVLERSLMPEGIDARLTAEDMRDLLAFLQHPR
jgi:putative membrane-bound dehydrogenase-like protein